MAFASANLVMDDDCLTDLGGDGYWREFLDRIRDIRSSEKVLYASTAEIPFVNECCCCRCEELFELPLF